MMFVDALNLELLQLIHNNPLWKSTVSFHYNDGDYLMITRQICIAFLSGKRGWVRDMEERGFIVRSGMRMQETEAWKREKSNVVAGRLALLRGRMEDGHFREKGFDPDWTSWADVPKWRCDELQSACPYYFLLRDLCSPPFRRPGILPSEFLPPSGGRRVPDGQRHPKRARYAGQESEDDVIDAYYDVSSLKHKLGMAHPDPDEDTPPPSQDKHRSQDRRQITLSLSPSPPPQPKRHKPFDSSYVPLHLPSSFFNGPDEKPGFEYLDPMNARNVKDLLEGARAAVPRVDRYWKATEKFVADHKLADERVMRHTNLRCFAAAYSHPKWSHKSPVSCPGQGLKGYYILVPPKAKAHSQRDKDRKLDLSGLMAIFEHYGAVFFDSPTEFNLVKCSTYKLRLATDSLIVPERPVRKDPDAEDADGKDVYDVSALTLMRFLDFKHHRLDLVDGSNLALYFEIKLAEKRVGTARNFAALEEDLWWEFWAGEGEMWDMYTRDLVDDV